MAVALILLDLDGTLVDTARDTADALNEVIRPFNIAPVTLEEARAVMGGREEPLVTRLFGNPALDARTLTNRFTDAYSRRLTVHAHLYPGVRPTLKRLAARPKVVLSNKRASLSGEILDHLGIRKYFDEVVGGDSGAGRKPSPRAILETLARFGTRPGEAVMVGDCVYDIDAGRAAGVWTVAVTYGYGGSDFTRGADFVIDRFPQLLDVVRELEKDR